MHDTYDWSRPGKFNVDEAMRLTSFPYTLTSWSPDEARDALDLLRAAIKMEREHRELKKKVLQAAKDARCSTNERKQAAVELQWLAGEIGPVG